MRQRYEWFVSSFFKDFISVFPQRYKKPEVIQTSGFVFLSICIILLRRGFPQKGSFRLVTHTLPHEYSTSVSLLVIIRVIGGVEEFRAEVVEEVGDDEARTVLDLRVYLTDIFTDDAEAEKLQAADEPY